MNRRLLTSKDNPLIKTIRLVAAQSRGAPPGLVLAEGTRMLEEVARAELKPEAILLSEAYGTTQRERDLIAHWNHSGVDMQLASRSLFRKLSQVLAPQGVLALVHVHAPELREVPVDSGALILCACGLQDPGNLGTLIRTAAAAGATMVCTTPFTVSPRNPKALRASAGAFFHIPVVEQVPIEELLAFCRAHSIQPYRSSSEAGEPHSSIDLRQPCALFLGNEGSGFQEREWRDAPAIRIPMAAGVDSLNVASAGAILLFESSRQRAPG